HRQQGPFRIRPGCDLGHAPGVTDRILKRTSAHETDYSRRNRHREPAEAHCLDDTRIADIWISVFWPESWKEKPLSHIGGGGKPLLTRTAEPNAEVRTVPCHCSHDS